MRIPKTTALFILLLAFFSAEVLAQSEQSAQSDYEIQKSFKAKYADFQQRLDTVSSADSVQKMIESIKEFDQKYSDHSELLDRVLYPESYNESIEKLKQMSVMAKNRVETMKERTERLEKLETQVSSYEQDLNQLNRESDSLRQAMQKSIQSEKELSGMVRQYRQSLEKRDDLILAFIDSMVVAYQQMDLQDLEDLENMDQQSRIQSTDALEMIRSISAENLEILRQNSDKLNLEDYMRMAEVQHQFEQMWVRLGDKIREVYDGENAESMAGEVEQNINEWNNLLKTQTFASLKDSLARNGIEVSGFETSDELYSSLNSYLEGKIEESRDRSTEEGYKEFKQFQHFWNQVELRWSSSFSDAGIIDRNEMATLNDKVDTWAEVAQPRSNNLLVYLLGASVLLAAALGFLLFRERKNKQ